MGKGGSMRSDRPSLQNRSVMLVVCLLSIFLIAAPTGLANGSDVKVFLGYTPGISNWGAFEANGLATINLGDGDVHLVVNHLPYDPLVQYQAWVVPVDEPTVMIALGSFNVDTTGHAEVDLSGLHLHTQECRFLVITAEPVPDEDEAPDPRRALAGVFPNSEARSLPENPQAFADLLDQSARESIPSEATPATPGSPGSAQMDAHRQDPSAPSTLPVTGAELPRSSAGEVTVLAGGLLMVTLVNIISRLHKIRGTGGKR